MPLNLHIQGVQADAKEVFVESWRILQRILFLALENINYNWKMYAKEKLCTWNPGVIGSLQMNVKLEGAGWSIITNPKMTYQLEDFFVK